MEIDEIKELLSYPFECDFIMKKQKTLKRILMEEKKLRPLNIAILGGSTTSEFKNILEIFLLHSGIQPCFYEGGYNRYYEESTFPNVSLEAFKPALIFLHTSTVNLLHLPEVNDTEEIVRRKLDSEFARYFSMWNNLQEKYNCLVLQNNFEYPAYTNFGNLDASHICGKTNYIRALNQKIAAYARQTPKFYMHDINSLSARIGLDRWHDEAAYYAYKFAYRYDVTPFVAHNAAAVIKAMLGKSKKCVVVDLDNTLWGGVIGDDGIDGIVIGKETPQAEAYTAFQAYILALKKRGVILAVCSKNDSHNAQAGLMHPDSVLKLDDFAAFKANWEPKHLNIIEIAKELNIGLDSIVFVDDNPAERKIVRDNLSEVEVPEIDGDDVTSYIRIMDQARYFEPVSISHDDLMRAETYQENINRKLIEKQFDNYDEFLKSLEMKAEIKSFIPLYLERIVQLTNKTNQFNLTTRRYTLAEIEAVIKSDQFITLYGKLSDRFGDNGLVSVIIGEIKGDALHIDLWLMSCRVLKRNFEYLMFEKLLETCMHNKIKVIVGYYARTAKNNMVKDLYNELGFKLVEETVETAIWAYKISEQPVNCQDE